MSDRNPCSCAFPVETIEVGGRECCRRCGGVVDSPADHWGLLVATVVIAAVALFVFAKVVL